jgi:hypothetical protein
MRIIIIALLVVSLISCNKSEDNSPNYERDTIRIDSLVMGEDYVNDIYYNLKKGKISEVVRNNWDIGFKTNGRSSRIIVNSTSGINLWEYPIEDTTKWNTMDTTGLKKSWKSLVNSDTTWSLSAFEGNQKGHPDYGWGVYNSITHDVSGNSIFVIQLQDGSYKKILIKKREAATNTYFFKYANLNGSSPVEGKIKCSDYSKKNFIYFNLTSKSVVDREPESDKWDILLTRYIAQVSMGPGVVVPYPVVGFLQNEGVLVARMTGDTASNNYQNATFKTNFSSIGRDWKKQVSQTSSDYTIVPNLYYFIKTKDKTTCKLVFKKFDGSPKSKVVFERKILK